MAERGTIIEGKYEVLKLIGKGGMSKVYLAMDKNLNKQWAIKEIERKAYDKKNEVVVASAMAEANMMKKTGLSVTAKNCRHYRKRKCNLCCHGLH